MLESIDLEPIEEMEILLDRASIDSDSIKFNLENLDRPINESDYKEYLKSIGKE